MKISKSFAFVCMISLSMSSCATVFGGKVDSCQRTKPADGGQTRQVRVGALVADILLFAPSLVVDFATNAIYKPCPANSNK